MKFLAVRIKKPKEPHVGPGPQFAHPCSSIMRQAIFYLKQILPLTNEAYINKSLYLEQS